MPVDSDVLRRLKAFRAKDKFSASAWDERGLIPSDPELCSRLDHLFNTCADSLIEEAQREPSPKRCKKILQASLSSASRHDYDTEESEFICEYFYQLSQVVNVDIKDDLNRWLYGTFLGTLIRLSSFRTGKEKVIDTISHDCTNCGVKLETFVLARQEGIPDSGWAVVKCDSCGEFNLLSHGPGIKELRHGHYKYVEYLSRDEYTEEEARTRMKQIKYFRKTE